MVDVASIATTTNGTKDNQREGKRESVKLMRFLFGKGFRRRRGREVEDVSGVGSLGL